jgi:hypothetical protein
VLELRVAVEPGHAPRVVVAFRTDPDRQGESGDVDSWPPRGDPRVRLVLGSLLEGLAAKLRLYRVEGTGGFTAAVRAAYIFVKQRRYPRKWWVRRFGLALLRQGVPLGCLPRLLRRAVAGDCVWASCARTALRPCCGAGSRAVVRKGR